MVGGQAALRLDDPQRSASLESVGQHGDIATLSRFIAKQLANPSPIIDQLALAPIWHRRNAALNDAAFAFMELVPQDAVLEEGFGGGMVSMTTRGNLAPMCFTNLEVVLRSML